MNTKNIETLLNPVNLSKMNEQEFKETILNRLSNSFKIREEWEGTGVTGQRLRIDALIKPIDPTPWKNKDVVFGIEFKRPSINSSMGSTNKHLKQAIDYSYTNWDHLGRIPILLCPAVSFTNPTPGRDNRQQEMILKHLLCEFNIGELEETERGLTILFAQHHRVWSERDGIYEGKRWSFKSTSGSK